jgi:hypothetical protein
MCGVIRSFLHSIGMTFCANDYNFLYLTLLAYYYLV